MTRCQQHHTGVAADEAGTAGDQKAMPHGLAVQVQTILLELGESAPGMVS